MRTHGDPFPTISEYEKEPWTVRFNQYRAQINDEYVIQKSETQPITITASSPAFAICVTLFGKPSESQQFHSIPIELYDEGYFEHLASFSK